MISRRGFLGLLGGGAAVVGLAGCGIEGQTGELLHSAAPLPALFRVPLPMPPVKHGPLVEISQRVGEVEILPGLRTTVLGYDGIFPGPTIESHRGEPVVVRHRNELPVPTVVHLHGGHTPPEHDGWPTDLVLPSGWSHHPAHGGNLSHGERDYAYPMDQRAATLWYHDHRMDFTDHQGRYLIHCHNLEHEDMAMMATFATV